MADSYLTFVSEEQKQVGVPANQAAPTLEHTLTHEPAERHEVAGAGSYFAGRGYFSEERYCPVCTGLYLDAQGIRPLLFILESQILRLPESGGLIFNF